MIGERFNSWTILEDMGRDAKSNRLYKCECTCGTIKVHTLSILKHGKSTQCKSCFLSKHNNVEDITNKKFGKWLVVKRVDNVKRNTRYECLCDCGTIKDVTGYRLKNGQSKSCQRCRVKRHGMSYTTTYSIWNGLFRRCYNKKSKHYKYYGARGIKVCKRWKLFENFYSDMGERPLGLSIDRINNDGNYEPGNCRWATHKEQRNNQRKSANLILGGC